MLPSSATSVVRRRVFACAVALATSLQFAACSKEPATAPSTAQNTATTAAPPRVVVIGLDAGTWDLLGPWMDKGLLPNLARLRASGAHGPLHSTQPSSSPVIWTSIATGKVPDKTGITWFVRFQQGLGKPEPVDRRMRKTKAIWNILGEKRFDVAVLGWYVTWPAEEVNGRLLSDMAHFGHMDGAAWPDHFLRDLEPVSEGEAIAAMPRFMDFAYDPAKAKKPDMEHGEKPTLDYLVYDRFLRAYARDKFYLDAAERTLKDGPLPEAFFLYLRGTDDVQHGFWKFMDPAAFAPRKDENGKEVEGTTVVPPEEVAAFGKVIERYWQWMDEGVGRILAHYKDAAPLVVVCSDHGAGPAVGADKVDVPEYLHLSGSHRIDGFLIASGPSIAPGTTVQGATIYDITPTLLYAMGQPVGRDMDGHALEQMFAPQARKPVEYVDTYDTGPAPKEASPKLPGDVDEKVLEHMRSLGYIQ